MSSNKYLNVIGGFMEDIKDEKGVVVDRVFREQRREIVREDSLAAFFRRDDDMAGKSVIHLQETNTRPRNELPRVSDYRDR